MVIKIMRTKNKGKRDSEGGNIDGSERGILNKVDWEGIAKALIFQ